MHCGGSLTLLLVAGSLCQREAVGEQLLLQFPPESPSASLISLSGAVYQQRTPAFPEGQKRHSSWKFEAEERPRWGSAPLWAQLMFVGLFSLLSVYIHLTFPTAC